jgi:hypothetical protein
MEGLGRLFDLAAIVPVVDLAGGAQTGNRIHLKNCAGVTFVLYKEAGAASEATTLTVQEHDAVSSGTSQDLDVVDHYYLKSETTLDGDETWSKVTQTAGDITPAASDTQQILAFYVDATWLSDGFEWISVNATDTGTTAGQLGGILAIMHDLEVQRAPANLANPQA